MKTALFHALLVPALLWAAPQANLQVDSPAVTTMSPGSTGIASVPSDTRWYGFLEFRPSYGSRVGEWHTEDTAEVGYYFNQYDRLFYSQWYLTNLFQPGVVNGGDGFRMDDGALRLRFDNIYSNGNFRIAYRNRIITPTKRTKRESGFVTSIRNDLVLIQKLSNSVTVDLSFVPTLHFYDRDGAAGAAHPMFGQQYVLNADWMITDRVRVSFPLIYEASLYHNYEQGARFNDSWGHNLWVWPEVAYTIDATHSVGLSYYSGNLMTDNGTMRVANGLENGIYQMLWAINL